MLAKAFQHTKQILSQNANSSLVAFTKRGVYKAGTEPYVFINKHTKVICQGMTGKHVSANSIKHESYRAHSTLSKPLTTEPRWWLE